ncbi:MAG: NAD-dependent protein deacylase, partial [Bacilli bacterium]|nr:NAD-dependent protein deacylase [Bacilli bacterium]
HCPECGGIIKPDVVLYEEPLNEDVVESALTELRFANFLIVGGTSLNVYPAAGMIDYFQGGHTLLINKEPTPRDSFFEYVIHDDIGKVLEELLS